MSRSQREIVENASRLARDLQAGPVVGKNAFLAVVGTFLSDPAGEVPRLRRIMTLVVTGSGGHLKRGNGFGDQVRLVVQTVGELLARGEWEPDELKSLFGWAARLLQVQQQPQQEADRNAGRTPGPRQGRGREEKLKHSRPSADPAFRAAHGKNLEVLKALSAKLSPSDRKKP